MFKTKNSTNSKQILLLEFSAEIIENQIYLLRIHMSRENTEKTDRENIQTYSHTQKKIERYT